jgi:hypothetical protein
MEKQKRLPAEQARAFAADAREAKLPVWARDELLRVRSELAQVDQRLRAFEGGDSRVSMGYEQMQAVGIPEDEPVNYAFGEGCDRQIRVTVDFARGELTVRGGDTISVLPEACNAVVVKLERR